MAHLQPAAVLLYIQEICHKQLLLLHIVIYRLLKLMRVQQLIIQQQLMGNPSGFRGLINGTGGFLKMNPTNVPKRDS